MNHQNAAPPRRAFITGGSVGLGQAIAIALAEDGYELALADLDAAMMKETLAHPAVKATKAIALTLDVRSQEQIERGIAEAANALGGLDVLVNNAGRQLRKPAVEVTPDEWDDVMAINAKGAFFLSTAFARYCFAEKREGAIVNIASTHGITGVADVTVYGISKATIAHITRVLAIEWATKGVRVNAVAPGAVMTPSRDRQMNEPGRRERALARIPMGRFPKAEEIATAVRYLASPQAAIVTGHVLVVDGGTSVI
jgi:2-deoxy-D-gluconate 3-dehydrogenase